MDIFFQDPDEIPLPPEEVRLRALRAEPWADGKRIKIYLETDPFQKHPSVEVTILGPSGGEATQITIVETVTRKLEFNMHLRTSLKGAYRVEAVLYYDVPLPADAPPDAKRPAPQIVDRSSAAFTI
ncbi:MAG TPA: hypothetical protein PKM21_14095 [Anaerolineales bacterium]|nr:hypothetical protein [Anaerolineales bacterium]